VLIATSKLQHFIFLAERQDAYPTRILDDSIYIPNLSTTPACPPSILFIVLTNNAVCFYWLGILE
jgi:hypothetical protein